MARMAMISDKKYRLKGLSAWTLMIWLLISIFGPVVTHEKDKGIIGPLIPYGPSTIDLDNASGISPLEKQNISSVYFRHWLGTDEIGRDVLAQLIHGSRTALLVGFLSVLLSAVLGILLGSFPAYLGNRKLSIAPLAWFLFLFVMISTLSYFLFVFPWRNASVLLISATLLFSVGGLILVWKLLKRYRSNGQNTDLPAELLAGRLIEVMDSLPILFIVITLSAIVKPSLGGVILIIGLSNWAGIARYARAETLKVKGLSYVEAAKALGMSDWRVLYRHILPNALPTVIVTLAFGIAAAILIEATLSFLGLGIGAGEASWGSMIAEASKDPTAWWLALFPGLSIFMIVYSCNKVGEKLLH